VTRRTEEEIEQELDRVQERIEAEPGPERDHLLILARKTLRLRLTPGQLTSAYGEAGHSDAVFNAAMDAANWMLGIAETRPSAVE
jgi:hypothetical protein